MHAIAQVHKNVQLTTAKPGFLERAIKKYYAPGIVKSWAVAAVLVIFAAWIGFSIFAATEVRKDSSPFLALQLRSFFA